MLLDIGADSLAALLVLDPELEPFPEPLRMQPAVTVVVDFEDYIKFVRTLPDNSNFLCVDTTKLKERIEVGDEVAVLKSFYVDMALAVCKELFFAEAYSKGATKIRHTFRDCVVSKEIYADAASATLLHNLAAGKHYPLPENFSQCNQKHWAYACKLIKDASGTPTRWVEKY